MVGVLGVLGVLAGCHRSPPAGSPIDATLVFGEVGLGAGQFNYPRAMDSDGRTLWIVDKSARVQRLDPSTGRGLFEFRTPEWAAGKPTGLTVWRPEHGTEDDVRLLVPDTHYHRVLVYTTKGELVARFGSYGTDPGQFIYPTDLAPVPSADGRSIARLYVSEYGGNDRVNVYEPDGAGSFRCVTTFGRFGNGSDRAAVEFSRPQSIALDSGRSQLVIADACNHRLGVFTMDGTLVRWIGHLGTPSTPDAPRPDGAPSEPAAPSASAARASPPTDPALTYPYGLALLGDGTALVAEFGGNRLQHVDYVAGTSLGVYGQAGRGPGQLATPWAVTTIGRTAYVLDSGNNRVIAFAGPRPIPDRQARGGPTDAGAPAPTLGLALTPTGGAGDPRPADGRGSPPERGPR